MMTGIIVACDVLSEPIGELRDGLGCAVLTKKLRDFNKLGSLFPIQHIGVSC